MARPEKIAVVDEIADKIQKTQSLYLTDFTGLDVEAINDLRRILRENAVEYRVVKNTLARLAAEKAGREDLKPHLLGPTAIAFGYEDPVLPARLLSKFAQKTGKPSVRAILFEGQLFGHEALDQIKQLRPRDEMIAQLLGGLQAPISRTAMVLSGILRGVVIVLDAIAKSKEEAGEQPEAEKPLEAQEETKEQEKVEAKEERAEAKEEDKETAEETASTEEKAESDSREDQSSAESGAESTEAPAEPPEDKPTDGESADGGKTESSEETKKEE